jgi:hypothetical protein
MSIGQSLEPESTVATDPDTGRRITQWTAAEANNYPLYYFIPSITRPEPGKPDYLVFHSERSSWVQLYRMDLANGVITQLTDGHTRNSGWALWCEWCLRGIYNHLSALNQATREVFYFQDEQLRGVHLDTLETRLVAELPRRICISQNGFSPDGRWFVFVHADSAMYHQRLSDRLAAKDMMPHWDDREGWRNSVPCTIGVVDTASGRVHDVIGLDFHVHHVFFVDNDRILVNHIKDGNGMWLIHRDGSGRRTLRPTDEHGGVVHQVVTDRGIYYEAVKLTDAGHVNHIGRYDLQRDTFSEIPAPFPGYIHTGWDPAGKFLFFEHHGPDGHELMSLHHPHDPQRRRFETLRRMAPYPVGRKGQRFHAHPFLSPDRRRLFYTEVIDGRSQVCSLDVADLVDRDEYWDAF